MIPRDDLHGLTSCPSDVQEFLTRIGGTNPHGEPIFRLVLAQNRYQKAAGEWNEWPDDADVSERGGIGVMDLHQLKEDGGTMAQAQEKLAHNLSRKPTKVTRGMVEVEKYALEGWVLERWYPASFYGSREEWNQHTFDGMPALGPYPQFGDYEMISVDAVERIPTLVELETAVRAHLRAIEERIPDPAQRMLLRLNELEERRARAHKNVVNKVDALHREIDTLRNRLSLGAGRVMTQLAENCGIRSHMGA